MNPFSPEYDVVLRRAVDHYNRGELDAAAELLESLAASGHSTQEAADLLADIALQRKLTDKDVAFREPPTPHRPIWPVVAGSAGAVVLLALIAALVWLRPWEGPPAVAEAPTAAPTAVPTEAPTAAPTAVPTEAPTAAPTAVPTEAPTAAPTAVPGATTGELAVRLPEGQTEVVRAPGNIAIILDASGSMTARVGETTKMEIAREALSSAVSGLPPETQLAMRVYGNQRSNDCTDISLLRPLGIHDRAELLTTISAIEPADLGMTPIGASLDALAGDLFGVSQYTAVLLVSDGGENCNGDPVTSAANMVAANLNLRISVIGFDIADDPAAGETLRAIAAAGGGNYFDAADSAALLESLQEAVKLSYRVLDPAGEVVATGSVGGAAVTLPPGAYRVLLDVEGAAEVPVEIAAGGETALELTEDGTGLAQAGQ
jgi:hypothetical protein